MRKYAIVLLSAAALSGLYGALAHGQGAAAPPPPPAPKDKAAYFSNTDHETTWKDLEARNVINKRVMEGGSHSINIRIVRPNDPPLVHALSADTWVVQAGSATAVTGGQLLDVKKNPNNDDTSGSSIKGGVEQPLKPGDILFVPPGVPHGFKDVKGFRAFLIRYPTK